MFSHFSNFGIHTTRNRAKKSNQYQPHLEALEDRLAPVLYSWNVAVNKTGLWDVASNWTLPGGADATTWPGKDGKDDQVVFNANRGDCKIPDNSSIEVAKMTVVNEYAGTITLENYVSLTVDSGKIDGGTIQAGGVGAFLNFNGIPTKNNSNLLVLGRTTLSGNVLNQYGSLVAVNGGIGQTTNLTNCVFRNTGTVFDADVQENGKIQNAGSLLMASSTFDNYGTFFTSGGGDSIGDIGKAPYATTSFFNNIGGHLQVSSSDNFQMVPKFDNYSGSSVVVLKGATFVLRGVGFLSGSIALDGGNIDLDVAQWGQLLPNADTTFNYMIMAGFSLIGNGAFIMTGARINNRNIVPNLTSSFA